MTKDATVVSREIIPDRTSIHEIEQMYKQADQIVGDFGKPSSFEAETEKLSNQALRKNETLSGKDEVVSGPYLTHQWLLSVIEDLAQYAKNENQPELQEFFEDAKFRVAELLFLKECQMEDTRRLSEDEH